jgi:hypothetical protein
MDTLNHAIAGLAETWSQGVRRQTWKGRDASRWHLLRSVAALTLTNGSFGQPRLPQRVNSSRLGGQATRRCTVGHEPTLRRQGQVSTERSLRRESGQCQEFCVRRSG